MDPMSESIIEVNSKLCEWLNSRNIEYNNIFFRIYDGTPKRNVWQTIN